MASVIQLQSNKKVSNPETNHYTTSTTPITKGFANKLASFLKDEESYKEWAQFSQLVESIITNPRNIIMRGITDATTDADICEKLIELLNSSPINNIKEYNICE